MNRIYLALIAVLLITGIANAQNLDSSNSNFANRRIINKKKFHVIYEEIAINKSVDEVWKEVAGNFMHIDKIVKTVNFTRCLSGDTTHGLGAKRLCNLTLRGKTTEIKEEIIEFKDTGDYRKFTYDVYEAKDIPMKSYTTWVVRKGADGKTYLGTAFIFRANIGILTGLVEKKLRKNGLREGITGYKHYLETGEKNVEPEKLAKLYPE